MNAPQPPHPTPSWVPEPGGEGEADSTIEANWLFHLRRERFRSTRSGRVHDYYVMRLADAVNVIALTPDRQLVLVRQFRAGSGHDSLEPPGGLLEPDEDPCEAGARELLEETGYAGDRAVFLGSAWSNPSIMSSKIAIIVVANARRVAEPKLDAGEEVSVELVPARSILRMIHEGRIDHALSVMSLLWWLNSERPGPSAPTPRVTIGNFLIYAAVAAPIVNLLFRFRDPLAYLPFIVGAAGLAGVRIQRGMGVFKDHPGTGDGRP
jgi:8-oxo-dGTP pyrophosphatase MutT (NUDIX family)